MLTIQIFKVNYCHENFEANFNHKKFQVYFNAFESFFLILVIVIFNLSDIYFFLMFRIFPIIESDI